MCTERERERERERQSERERDISAFRIIHKLGGRNKVENRWRYINSYIHALYLPYKKRVSYFS